MAAIPPIRTIYTQDIIDSDGNVEGEKLLYPLNLFMESSYTLFDKGLTFSENIVSQSNTITFTTASTYTASNTFVPITYLIKMSKRPEGVILLQTQVADNINTIITNPVTIDWREAADGLSISIGFITGLANSTKYNVSLLTI